MSVASQLMEKNPPRKLHPNIFDWNSNIILHASMGPDKIQIESHSATRELDMDLRSTLHCLKDAKTGEEIVRVVAYDAGRGLVTRILLDEEEGKPYIDASGDEIAKTTEKRYLIAEGGELADLINQATKEAIG